MLMHPPSVLVVDDDDRVREIIVEILQDAGFGVAAAASGWEALDLMEARSFDLAIVDVGLPGDLSGLDLVRCVRARRPQLRCLFISGWADPTIDDPERDDFVRKPFRLSELLGCAWELLQRKVPETPLDLPQRRQRWLIEASRVDCLRRERKHGRRKRFLAAAKPA